MRVLFIYNPHPRLTLSSAIQTEIIQGHLKRGDEVYMLGCDGELNTCYLNSSHRQSICLKCKIAQKNINEINQNLPVLLNYFSEYSNNTFQFFESIDEVKNLEYKGIKIGLGVASTFISTIRDHLPDIKPHLEKINKDINTAIMILESFERHYNSILPDVTYVFNGRFAYHFPIVDFCKKNRINFKTYEFTANYANFHLIDNTIPHDVDYENRDILKSWEDDYDLEKKIFIGSSFFEKTRNGDSFLEDSFVHYQINSLIPDELVHKTKKIITFFNSSIDEFASVPGWERPFFIYEDEYIAIRSICSHYKEDKTKLFVLRVHPNLKHLDNTQNRRIKQLSDLTNLIIIPAESKVDTYGIIDASDCVITFGSTIGVEATYWGKPSILLGLSYYMDIDCTFVPQSETELFYFIDSPLQPKDKLNAIKYGYWWINLGTPFEYFNKGLFSEKQFHISFLTKIRILLLKIAEISPSYLIGKAFSKTTYLKLLDPGFRKKLLSEFKMWNK